MVDFHTWILMLLHLLSLVGKALPKKKKKKLGNSDEIVTELQNLIWTFLNDLTYGT